MVFGFWFRLAALVAIGSLVTGVEPTLGQSVVPIAASDGQIDWKPPVIDTSIKPIVTIKLPKNSGATMSGRELILPECSISLKFGKQSYFLLQLRKDGSLDRITVYPTYPLKYHSGCDKK